MDNLTVIKSDSKCSFCGISENNNLKYGPMYKLGKIQAHYYCVLLSNRLIQNGNDNEGILGFLLSDIQKELQRTSKVICVYCKKGNATIKCAGKKCRRSFHLPCGLKGGSLNQFTKQFKSFCHLHRPSQGIPSKILKVASKTEVICCICYEKVDIKNKINSLWAPCCVRTWYHRFCVQKLAHSAGYFFKCAACNNSKKFVKWMQKFGIFIPQQDASWELVPNAFEDLLYRHNKCDAEICNCPDGRQKNAEDSIWKIVLCQSCGSQGVHVACGNLKFVDSEWECLPCQKISQNMRLASENSYSIKPDEGSSEEEKLSKLMEVSHKKRRRGSEDLENSILDKRKKFKTLDEEDESEDGDEIEIDVVTVEEELESKDVTESVDKEKNTLNLEAVEVKSNIKTEFEEILAVLKPGPLSYKLSSIRKIFRGSPQKNTIQDWDSLAIIELSDSDDDVTLLEEKSGSDFYLISPDLMKKSEEEQVNAEVTDDDYDDDDDDEDKEKKPLNKLSFSLTFNSKKLNSDEQLFFLNTDFCCNGFNGTHTSSSNLSSSVKSENTHHWYSEEEVSIEESKIVNKVQSDFIEVSDDEIILIE